MADLKASLCGELPNQESVIPKEQLRNLLERRGIVGDPDIPNAKARLAEQELRRNMYHNIWLLRMPMIFIVPALQRKLSGIQAAPGTSSPTCCAI